ncbi:MAG: hypothetical protein JKY60_08280 [Kordiimonadaceae bacterium]|nr:hypothetical protein [Kordiimonadaceae bacterium]
MADYFCDLVGRQKQTVDLAVPLIPHLFARERLTVAETRFMSGHLIEAEKMPSVFAKSMKEKPDFK